MPSDITSAVARMRSTGPESLSAKVPRVWFGEADFVAWQRFCDASRTDAPLLADTLHRLSEIVGCEVGELEERVHLMSVSIAAMREAAACREAIESLERKLHGDPTP